MKKINLKEKKSILYLVSISIVIINVTIGIALSLYMAFKLSNVSGMYIDGSDLSDLIKVFGAVALPVISLYIIGIFTGIALIMDAIIWGIYGIIILMRKLLKKTGYKIFYYIGIILIIIFLMINIFINILVNVLDLPVEEDGTIRLTSYNYNIN